MKLEIECVREQNYKVYGVRKVWHQLRRDGFDVARCTVAWLMKDLALEGISRGKKHRTTILDKSQPCPLDKMNRRFKAPAQFQCCGIRNLGVGGLVLRPPAAGTHRKRSASRGRGKLPCSSGKIRHGPRN